MRQSHSHIKLYQDCPSAENSKYRLKLPEIPTEAAQRGSREHQVFYDYGVHCLNLGVATDLDYIRGRLGTDEDREIFEKFADTHLFEFEFDNYFEFKVDVQIGSYEFRAVIDHLVDNYHSIILTDYKTWYKAMSQADVEQDSQLRRYAVVASKKFPDAREFVCRVDFVRLGIVREVTYTLEQVADFERQLIEEIEECENATEFPATPGTYCDWCSYSKGCPAVEAANIDVVTNAEEAEKAAAQWLALDARRNAIKAPLSEWCSKNGIVEVGGKEVGFFKSESYEYPDTAALKKALSDLGFDPDDYFKPDTTGLKKAAKKSAALEEALLDIAIDKSSTKFTSKKAVTS